MRPEPVVHDFNESLERSASYADAPWWLEVYRKAFPGMATMTYIAQDGWAQRGGIDRSITMKSGKTITVDEKVREKDWSDILLERWSDRGRQTPGWIQKDLACDYIAYAFAPSQVCYVLPFPTLRLAWKHNGRDWIEAYKPVLAKNRGYVTESVPVPISVLLPAINTAMRIEWGREAA